MVTFGVAGVEPYQPLEGRLLEHLLRAIKDSLESCLALTTWVRECPVGYFFLALPIKGAKSCLLPPENSDNFFILPLKPI